ncbi:MAG TPA: extracellular solute-binding protein [Anaerolineae bacterium]|nr:extracellular solute-binding protein [Anaerolineae bacterium]HIQ05696.1 extracellular solute-binding protein [Anaerolineae bacterium]
MPVEVTKIVEKEVVKEVPGRTIQFWSTETQPARAAKTQEILKRFEEKTGIHVELILTDEDALPELTTAAVAAGTLPDVIFHPVDFTMGWTAEGILDPQAATEVIEALGAGTFSAGALDMVKTENGYAAVPCDGWGQLLIYRKDLFDKAGLEAPTTYDTILKAAEALNDPENNFYGITLANAAGKVMTQQTFEHVALANNCQLVNDAGEVTLNTPECVEAIKFYADVNKYAPPGESAVVETRATYFAGRAAMIIWSPFILDEMAGLRDSVLPACPECKDDPQFLAKNSGFVPAFAGPSGAPAQYGQISYMGITTNADKEAAAEFLKFWLDEGYLDWLSVSVEGKFPMRRGTPDEPDKFIRGWSQLETGVDRKAKLGDIYGDEVIDLLVKGTANFARWGFAQGQGVLVAAVYEALPVPAILRDVLDGNLTPEDAAAEMQAEVEALKSE